MVFWSRFNIDFSVLGWVEEGARKLWPRFGFPVLSRHLRGNMVFWVGSFSQDPPVSFGILSASRIAESPKIGSDDCATGFQVQFGFRDLVE